MCSVSLQPEVLYRADLCALLSSAPGDAPDLKLPTVYHYLELRSFRILLMLSHSERELRVRQTAVRVS